MKEMMLLLTFLIGFMVLVGWRSGSLALISVMPGLVTMKTTTAICIMLSSVLVWSIISRRGPKRLRTTLTTAATFGLMAFIFFVGIYHLFHISFGVESLFAAESPELAVYSVAPGEPSLATTFCFMLLIIFGLAETIKDDEYLKLQGFISGALLLVSSVALVGYAIGRPDLYYYFEGTSTAMALHTALSLNGLGACLMPSKAIEVVKNAISRLFTNNSRAVGVR